ncbi:hypothetical protein ACROYT_G044035 [Oculina patagonica]
MHLHADYRKNAPAYSANAFSGYASYHSPPRHEHGGVLYYKVKECCSFSRTEEFAGCRTEFSQSKYPRRSIKLPCTNDDAV